MILFSHLGQGVANLRAQKTRTLLTALGIVFGVGSVIGMLAIGSGAREESLRFIEQLGVRNVLVDSRPATSQEEFQQRRRSSPGLSDRDVRILKANIEALETLSARKAQHLFPEYRREGLLKQPLNRKRQSRRTGQRPDFAELARQLVPGYSAIGGAIDLAADAAGIDQCGVSRIDGEVPQRAVGPFGHLRRLPGRSGIG